MENNIYNDMSVFDAVDKINNNIIILPDIQREFCWKIKDIEELFYSIINDYPIGSFIIWKTNGKNLNASSSSFYKFLDEARYKKKSGDMISNNIQLKRNFRNADYYVVLDGQQRLTSFYLVFNGKFNIKKIGSYGSDNKDCFFDEKELFYDLNHYDEGSNTESNPFIFLTEEEKNDGNYYAINSMIKYKEQEMEFYENLANETRNYNKKVANDLSKLFARLSKGERDQSLIHYYTINSKIYDDALNVFVKVNSSGKPLNKTDLLFSTLINGWEKDSKKKEDRRKEIENYISMVNEKYSFDIDKDFLLRTIFVLTNSGKSNLSIEEICKNDVIIKIRSKWRKSIKAIEKVLKILNEININDARILSYNAIIPIIYYVYLGGKFITQNSREELKKYFAIAFSKGLFGGSSNQAIENTCKDIKKNIKKEFCVDYFNKTELSNGRNFSVHMDDINKWLCKYEKGKKTYSILMLLSPNIDLLKEHYDQDHSHAYSLFNDKKFKKLKISIDKLEMWKKKRNLLPNLSFMIYYNNRSKNDDDLDTWMSKNGDKICNLRCLPLEIDYSFKNFEQFFVMRLSMMKYILTNIFGVEHDQIDINDEITINRIPKNQTHLKVGMHGKVIGLKNNIATVNIHNKNDNIVEKVDINIENLYVIEKFQNI